MLNLQSNPILADALPAMSHNDLQIHSTYDLNVFKILEGNRNINLLHVERLVKSIEENGFLKMPIIVNKNYEVIDGQHRLEAAKKSKSMVYYIIEKNVQKRLLHIKKRHLFYLKCRSQVRLKKYEGNGVILASF